MRRLRFFTSIELVVVIAIISMMFGLTTVYYFNFKSATVLKLAAYDIAATLNQARSLAITSQDEYSVVFDVGNNRYEIQDSSGTRVDEEHRLDEGIVFDLVKFGGSSLNIVSYFPTGTADSGRVILKDNKNKYHTIKVLNVTGRVKVLNFRQLPGD